MEFDSPQEEMTLLRLEITSQKEVIKETLQLST